MLGNARLVGDKDTSLRGLGEGTVWCWRWVLMTLSAIFSM